MSHLKGYLVGAAASPGGGEAIVILVEPNGDEHRVICRLMGPTTEIRFADPNSGAYLDGRYGPNVLSGTARRAALGLTQRDPDPSLDHPSELHAFLLQRTTEAFDYARVIHSKQVRKGTGAPALSHLMAVSALVLEHGGNEDEAIAALLHDAVEDAGGLETLAEIKRLFGDRVAAIVEGCSESVEEPKPEWRDRKERQIAHVVSADPSTLLVLAADKLHNAMTLRQGFVLFGGDLWQRFKGGRDGTLWHLEEMSKAILQHPECTGEVRRLALRLEAEVRQLADEA